jgi:predicted nucleic-acid-binding Zn-ribbon protein
MANFFKTLKRAANAIAASRDVHTYKLQGKAISCPHCRAQEFDEGSALLNTAGMTFLNLDWANRSAIILACKSCGHVQWFLQKPEKTEPNQDSSKNT